MEKANNELKESVFNKWKAEKCEAYVDTLKTMSLMSMSVPPLPSDAVRVARGD
jgi:hypothetical protein